MYRTARNNSPPDTILTCRVCAKTTPFAFDSHGVFTCEECGREQPVVRALDDMKLLETKVVSLEESKRYTELTPFVHSLTGRHDNATEVKAMCDGKVVVVALAFNSGTVTGTDLVVQNIEAMPLMSLLPEGGAHRKAKASGLSRETQTGDEEFDAAVYIESQLTDESIQRFFSSPAVRKAVMRLVRDTIQIDLGPDKISLHVHKDKAFDPTLIRERITCLRILAGAPRLVRSAIVPETRAVKMTKLAGYLLAPFGLVLGLFGGIAHGPIGSKPYLFCIVLGIAIALASRLIVGRIFRGRSTSHTDLAIHTVLAVLFMPFITMGILFVANAWLATSNIRTVEMRVKSSREDSDDHSRIDVDALDPDDSDTTHSYHFTAANPAGAKAFVVARWRRGALGWTVEIGDPYLSVPSK